MLWETLEGPVERENPEAKIKSQHPQTPPAFAVLDFNFGEGVFPVPLAGVERGVQGARGCPTGEPRPHWGFISHWQWRLT